MSRWRPTVTDTVPPIPTPQGSPAPGMLGDALQDAVNACFILRTAVQIAGHPAPVIAIAGGWIRDRALGLPPKDMDVFIPAYGLSVNEMGDIAVAAASAFYDNARVVKLMKSYGTWAEDLEVVYKLTGDRIGDALPEEIDFVFIRCPEPDPVDYASDEVLFLDYVLSRVDIRLNSIGATASKKMWNRNWLDDVAHGRLVVQQSRMGESDDRNKARMRRRLAAKFIGWKPYAESMDGQSIYELTGDGWTA